MICQSRHGLAAFGEVSVSGWVKMPRIVVCLWCLAFDAEWKGETRTRKEATARARIIVVLAASGGHTRFAI
jgi:hypothetical protein